MTCPTATAEDGEGDGRDQPSYRPAIVFCAAPSDPQTTPGGTTSTARAPITGRSGARSKAALHPTVTFLLMHLSRWNRWGSALER